MAEARARTSGRGLWLYKRDCRRLSGPFLPYEDDTVNKMTVCGPGIVTLPDTESASTILEFANSQMERNGFGLVYEAASLSIAPPFSHSPPGKKLNVARNKRELHLSRGHEGSRSLESSRVAGLHRLQPGRITEAVRKSWPIRSVTYLSVFAYLVFKFPLKSSNLHLTSYLSCSLLSSHF